MADFAAATIGRLMDLDAADAALIETLVPEEAVVTGFLVVVTFMEPSGSHAWKVHCDADLPCSQVLGFLELAKLDVVARSNTGLPINYPDE